MSQVVKGKGGALAGKRKAGPAINLSPQESDHQIILNAFALVLPGDIKGFMTALGLSGAENLYAAVMENKNSDRILKCFMQQIAAASTVEVF